MSDEFWIPADMDVVLISAGNWCFLTFSVKKQGGHYDSSLGCSLVVELMKTDRCFLDKVGSLVRRFACLGLDLHLGFVSIYLISILNFGAFPIYICISMHGALVTLRTSTLTVGPS